MEAAVAGVGDCSVPKSFEIDTGMAREASFRVGLGVQEKRHAELLG